MKQKIYFRADASPQIGYGHFIRSLALADMLREEFTCTFFTTHSTKYQLSEISKVCPSVLLEETGKFDDFLNCLTGEEIVVLDNYFFTTEYQRAIKGKGCKLVCIDDTHNKHYVADVLINHALTNTSLFDCEPYTKLCLGFDWALLRLPFLANHSTKREEGRWFLSFGGTDYHNMTEKYLSILQQDDRIKTITVVIGDAYQYTEYLQNYDKATILKNITAEQMACEMQRAEYAILPCSTVCIEALACGCKVAAGYFVDNQKEFAYSLKAARSILGLDDLRNGDKGIVDSMINHEYIITNSFQGIPTRYVHLFKTI